MATTERTLMRMHRKALITVVAPALGVAMLLAAGQPVAAATSQRADLIVRSGSARVVGDRLVGSFVARNIGRRTAGRSVAAVTLSDGSVLQRTTVRRLTRHRRATIRVSVTLPRRLRPGTHRVRVCLDARHHVKERSERNNCRSIGSVTIAQPAAAPVLLDPPPDVPTHVADGTGDY